MEGEDVYAAAREEYRAKIREQAKEIERLRLALYDIEQEALSYAHHGYAKKASAALAQPAAPKQKTEMKLNINEEQFLAAVDRDGDHEIGVGLFAQPAAPGGDA